MTNYPHDVPANWPELLDRLRDKESLSSDAKLATSLGVTRGYICSVRKGRKRVSLELANEIFARLGRTFDTEQLECLFVPMKVRTRTAHLKALRDQVIERANGRCQLCGSQAPFNSPDGRPYLEVRHVIPASEGGDDSPSNLVALCPNCNRKIEVAPNSADQRKLELLAKKYQK